MEEQLGSVSHVVMRKVSTDKEMHHLFLVLRLQFPTQEQISCEKCK